MHDKLRMKSPTDFSDPEEWREYVRSTVPRDDIAFALAFGRTILFARFYEVRDQAFPIRFCAELSDLVSFQEPERTHALQALNDRIFADITRLTGGGAAQSIYQTSTDPVDTRHLIDDLLTFLARENPSFEIWTWYTEPSEKHPDASSQDEYVRESFGTVADEDVEFALLMAQLNKLLRCLKERNLALPPHTFSRSWFLHHVHGTERNVQARAVVQELIGMIEPCAFA